MLVGDSLGMTVLGHASTLPVTLDDMVRATSAVARSTGRVLVIADMPFGSYQASTEDAVRNATRLVAEGGAHAVKLEGAGTSSLANVERLVEAGIPVMGHIGLTPQSVNVMGGYKIQGKSASAAASLMAQAVLLERAGAFSMVLEGIPRELGERITGLLSIPTIGIGAGAGCDGEVQVFADLLGLGGIAHLPRHARRYADAGALMREALEAYADDVRTRSFPTAENALSMDAEELAEAEIAFGLWERVEGHTRPESEDETASEAEAMRTRGAS
jgi:3-methyl-2-oxobutanoate hydroxymethyltransferase